MHRGTRRLARVATLALTAAAFVVPLAMKTPAHAIGPTVTATPNDNLVGGQHISASGSGFAAGENLFLIECTAPAPTPAEAAADCNTGHVAQATADGSGNFSGADFIVTSGAVGNGGAFCPSKTAGGACYLVAADQSTASAVASTTLTFAPVISLTPSKNVKSGQSISVSGYGFPAAQTAYITECANPPSANTCNAGSNVMQQTDANGTFSNVKVKVTTGTWGGKSCTAGGVCLMTATTDISATQPDQSTAAQFTFANVVSKVKTSLFLNPGKVAHHKVKLSGVIENKSAAIGVKGLKLAVYERAKGAKKWHKVKSTNSHKSGVFAVKHLKHFKHKEQYKVTHKKQKVGSTIYLPSHSKPVTVK